MNSADDVQLMTRLADGDKQALAELVQRHQQRVLELAYRLSGDWALAEDLAQDTFLRVWRSADRYRPQARFTTWLHRIVVNLCLDASKKRRPATGGLPDNADARVPPPPAAADRGIRAAAVQQAVARLPERQRVALVLHRFSGLPVRVIAEATGWSESAVESLLVRAYSALRESLRNLAGP